MLPREKKYFRDLLNNSIIFPDAVFCSEVSFSYILKVNRFCPKVSRKFFES